MSVRKMMSIRSNDLHYIYLFFISIVLVVWQYFGMSLKMNVVPDGLSVTQVAKYNDAINNGYSTSQLTNDSEKILLDCNIVHSQTFAFCGLSIPLVIDGEIGVDMRKYSHMEIELEYRSIEKDTLLVYLVNQEDLGDGNKLEKSNLWAVSPDQGLNSFTLDPHRFILPSWWIYQNSRKGLNLEADISNVTALRITTGDNANARNVHIEIRNISFSGKLISSEDLYLGLLATWLTLFTLQGLITMRVLADGYKQSKQQNEKLVKLNQFLRIQKNQYESMAKKDKLTGAWNRAGVRDVLESVLEKHKTNRTPCSLLSIDIDHFKKINDEFGHDVGDQALKALSELIEHHTREEDYFARWGGEEFVLICPGTDLHAAEILAATLKNIIESTTLIKQRKISCSFGIAELGDEEIDQWFKRADIALYRAKKAGRNLIMCA